MQYRNSLIILALVALCATFVNAENYAVIITGDDPYESAPGPKSWNGDNGDPPSEVYDEFWNDTFLWWEALFTYGWKDENIYVLFAWGVDWTVWNNPRYRLNEYNYNMYPWYIDHITDDSASTGGIERTFNTLSQVMTNEDFLFVYVFDHGGYDQNFRHANFGVVDNNSFMWDTTFARIVDQCNYGKRVICMQQCHSGGFIDDLINEDTYIMTAADIYNTAHRADNFYPDGGDPFPYENELWWGDSSAYHHGELNYHALNALRLETIYYKNPLTIADKNNDGLASCKEIWQWVDSTSTYFWMGDSLPTYEQAADSGEIADSIFLNIPPYQPTGFAGQRVGDTTVLTWNANIEYDLDHYDLYKKIYDEITQAYTDWYLLAHCTGTSFTDSGFIPSPQGEDSVWYKLAAVDEADRLSEFTEPLNSAGFIITSGHGYELISMVTGPEFNLVNYPQPFNPTTCVRFTLPEASYVTLNVYDTAGRIVAELITGYLSAGIHETTFNGQSLASGLYICRLKTDERVLTQKLILMK